MIIQKSRPKGDQPLVENIKNHNEEKDSMEKQSLKKSSKQKSFYRREVPEETKKEETTKKFPRIYRFITERRFLVSLFCLILLVLIGFSAYDFYGNFKKWEAVQSNRQKLEEELWYWQRVAATHKGYRDAYFKLAILEYQLKDNEKAREYLNRTLKLDPNFEPALKLQKLLKGG